MMSDGCFTRKSLELIGALILVILAFVPIILAVFRSPIASDSAYYLLIVERISEGQTLYKDIACGYTPLWFYLMAGIKRLFHIPYGCWEAYQSIHFLFQLGIAYFIYKILQINKISLRISLFAAWLFVLMSHWMQGNIVLLEMPSLFFGMLSIWATMKYKDSSVWYFLLIGFVCSCSFLCKQFGFGFFFLVLLILFKASSNRWEKYLFFFLGYLICLVAFVVAFEEYSSSLIFSTYGTKSAAEAGRDISISAKIWSVVSNLKILCTRVAIIIPISLFFVKFVWKKNFLQFYVLCLCGIVGFMMQYFFVSGGYHYMLYTLPFIAMLSAILLSLRARIKYKHLIIYCSLCLMSLYSLYSVYNNRVRKIYLRPIKEINQQIALKVQKTVPENSTLWIVHGGLFPVYYWANRLPPNMNTVGYTFGPLGLNESRAFAQAKDADYILSYTHDFAYESFYTDSLKKFVWSHKSDVFFIHDTIALHNMSIVNSDNH